MRRRWVLATFPLAAFLAACSGTEGSNFPGAPGSDGGSSEPPGAVHDGGAGAPADAAPVPPSPGVDASAPPAATDSGSPTPPDAGEGDAAPPSQDLDAGDGADAPAGPFALTSPNLTPSADVPKAYTCATLSSQNTQGTGGDASPPLDWSGAPSGAQSFALVLHDQTNGNVHWVLYDVPASVTSLAGGLPKRAALSAPAGAQQTKSYDGSYGYMGPCPNTAHVYTFTLYAMPAATTPGIDPTNRAGAEAKIKAAALGTATLKVTSSDSKG